MKFFTILSALLLSTGSAMAEEANFNLNNLPEGFSFVSTGDLGTTTVIYMGRNGTGFEFMFDTIRKDGTLEASTSVVNSNSQTVSYDAPDWSAVYQPHDCAPNIGDCQYTSVEDGKTYQFIRSSYKIGDIWVSEELILGENQWLFNSITCSTYDEFGFWIDYVLRDWDGKENWGVRVSPPLPENRKTRIDKLWDACNGSPDLTS